MSTLCPGTRFQLIQTAMRMKHERTIFGAATLLLVVGAAITLASEGNSELEYENLIKFFRPREIWSPRKCTNLIKNLPDKTFSSEPKEMREQLIGLLKKPQESTRPYRDSYIRLFISLTQVHENNHCSGIHPSDVMAIISTLNGIEKFKPYVELLTHYASQNFRPCATTCLEQLEKELVGPLGGYLKKWDELFGAGLNDDASEMCKLVSKVDLARHKLDVRAMLHVARKYHKFTIMRFKYPNGSLKKLFEFIAQQCDNYIYMIRYEVGIINVARFIGAIKEEALTCTFRLVNEYAHFCARFLNEKDSGQIKVNFENWYKEGRKVRQKPLK